MITLEYSMYNMGSRKYDRYAILVKDTQNTSVAVETLMTHLQKIKMSYAFKKIIASHAGQKMYGNIGYDYPILESDGTYTERGYKI